GQNVIVEVAGGPLLRRAGAGARQEQEREKSDSPSQGQGRTRACELATFRGLGVRACGHVSATTFHDELFRYMPHRATLPRMHTVAP
ncbi:MAG: hypothetical protein ACOC71_04375, partial [Hyphomicrobiales bacterium]